jgi:extradiol dioxygenase family protein
VGAILHLSLPVSDLAEARTFYVDRLGCTPGRVRDGWFDVWFHGMQVTLHEAPGQVLSPEAGGVRHFGVTLPVDEFDRVVGHLEAKGVHWVTPVRTDHPGTPVEQRKAKLADPSGNVIELKAYADPARALAVPPGDGPLSGTR